ACPASKRCRRAAARPSSWRRGSWLIEWHAGRTVREKGTSTMNRRFSEAAQRTSERREREDRAPRLLAEVPRLQALDLVISESRSQSTSVDTKYVRRIVVASAPALFDITCSDASCRDGGHQVTYHVLRQL